MDGEALIKQSKDQRLAEVNQRVGEASCEQYIQTNFLPFKLSPITISIQKNVLRNPI